MSDHHQPTFVQRLFAFVVRIPIIHQIIKFGLVGSFNTLIDYGLYIGLTRFTVFGSEHVLLANACAFLVANTSSFFLNKHYTFENHTKQYVSQYTRFFVVSIVYLGIVQLVMFVGLEYAEMPDLVAKMMATAIGMLWNFVAHRHWSFA